MDFQALADDMRLAADRLDEFDTGERVASRKPRLSRLTDALRYKAVELDELDEFQRFKGKTYDSVVKHALDMDSTDAEETDE